MTFRKLTRPNERGFAAVIVLSLILMLSTVGLMALQKSTTEMSVSFNEVRYEQAFRIAEAGLERAMVQLNADEDWRAGFADEGLGNGRFTVALLDSTSGVTSGDTLVVRSTAFTNTSPESKVILERWLVPAEDPSPFQWAVFGDERLFMQNYACTDSYNSDSGTYVSTVETMGGHAGSNGAIEIQNDIVVGGDLVTSDTGNWSEINSPTIWGDTSTTAPPQTMDPIPSSEFTDAQSNNTAPAGISGPYSWNPTAFDLFVDDNKTITLQSGTYYFKSIHLESNSKLLLAAGANVTLYVDNDIFVENGTLINSAGKPSQLVVKSRGTILEFQDNTEFRGAIYAPNVDFLHQSSAALYGSILAKKVEIKNNSCVHYDRALIEGTGSGSGTFAVVGWREL